MHLNITLLYCKPLYGWTSDVRISEITDLGQVIRSLDNVILYDGAQIFVDVQCGLALCHILGA